MGAPSLEDQTAGRAADLLMKYSIQEIAKQINARLVTSDASAASVEIGGVASITSAGAGDLVFVDDARFLEAAMASKAAAVIASDAEAKAALAGKPLLICQHPKLAFARAAVLLAEARDHQLGVHASAIVHKSAKLALGASVGALATIGD